MNMPKIKQIPKPVSGGLILSYTCSAECRHCIYACSQKWPADWILLEDLEKILRQLSGLYHFAKDLGFMDSGEGYLSKCHLCMEIRKYLSSIGDFTELQPKEFYQHLE